MKKNLDEITMEFINDKKLPYLKKLGYSENEEILILGASFSSFQDGYNIANKKFEQAKELIEYFVNRVEEGSIKSKNTYKLYKEFLENN